MKRSRLLTAILISTLTSASWAAPRPTLIRYPTASDRAIAFVARGDLWISGSGGGVARRLVHSAGHILASRFSPDGRWIAYTERAHGGQDVFVVAAAGGDPRQLTHDALPGAGDNLVVSWTPDGSRVLFLSTRMSIASSQVQGFSVALTGGLAERLPFDQTGRIDVSPIDGRIAYTRSFTDLAARKRYVGGKAEDIFFYDPATHRLDRITDWKGTDTAPMWAGHRLYFLSDRGPGFRLNLWCYDLETHATRQVTHFADYDIDWPSIGGGRIVFQQAGRLWALELNGEHLHALAVTVPDDGKRTVARSMSVGREARATDVGGAVNYAVAPDGRSVLLAAHGDLFSIAAEHGATTDLTASTGTNEDHPAISPDGRTIAYITEDDRAQQVAIRSLSGGPERRLTRFGDGVLYAPVFSPDGRCLAVADAEHRLWLVPFSGKPVLVARDPVAEIRDAVFSPDGRWLAYSTMRVTGLPALHLTRLSDGRDTVVSGVLDGDRLPAFSADGKRLYFVSQRNEYVVTGDRGDEASLATIASDGLYVANLGSGPDGLMSRASALPVTPGRITSLTQRGDDLFYQSEPAEWIGGELPGSFASLHRIAANGVDAIVLSNFQDQTVSGDGRHVLFRRDGEWRVHAVGGADAAIDLSHIKLRVDPRAEWKEMLAHAWRLDRDVFFNRRMNGSDWPTVYRAYSRLLPLAGSRDDFLYLLGQMQGELATSHAFIGGLDADDASLRVATPRLGADLTLDPASGRYRFAHIFTGDATRPRFRAPFNDPQATIKVVAGDYLLAIDGVDFAAPMDPDALLAGKNGPLTLTVAAAPDGERRQVTVTPLTSDTELRRYAWVEANRRRVSETSAGKLGYVYLANFSASGAQELTRQLQGQTDRDGLVIDVRWNGGGFTSQGVLSILKRERVGAFVNREGAMQPLPLVSAPRVMTVITNAQTASDGDQFPYYFRAFGLGPVIGQRTWGGVQGIKGPWPLLDGTNITIPKDALATTDGRWIIENTGTVPDIVIDPDPDEAETGRDHVLEQATNIILRQMKQRSTQILHPPALLPAYPAAGNVPGAHFLGPTDPDR